MRQLYWHRGVRENPSLDAKKTGLLEYQETVKVTSIQKEKVTIDGITSSWYEVVSEKGIKGYAFGGYLIPLYKVKIENYDTFTFTPLNKDLIEQESDDSNHTQSPWQLVDGLYSPKTITIETPCLERTSFRGDDWENIPHVYIKDGNLSFINGRKKNFHISSQYYLSTLQDFREYLGKYAMATENNQDKVLWVYEADRSGGGDSGLLTCSNDNLKYTFTANNMAFFEEVSFDLKKDSTQADINLEITFPWFVNAYSIDAYSTKDVSGKSDLILKGNQRDDTEFARLTAEGWKSIIELTGMESTPDGIVYEALYKGKKVWIKADFIYAYKSHREIEHAIGFEYGL